MGYIHQPTMIPGIWRRCCRERLRRNYVALLVPEIAKVLHADHPQKGGQQQLINERAIAIRRAADTCLIQALTTVHAEKLSARKSAVRLYGMSGPAHFAVPCSLKPCYYGRSSGQPRGSVKLKASTRLSSSPHRKSRYRLQLCPLKHLFKGRSLRAVQSLNHLISQGISRKARRRTASTTRSHLMIGLNYIRRQNRTCQYFDDHLLKNNEEVEAADVTSTADGNDQLRRLHSVLYNTPAENNNSNPRGVCTVGNLGGGGRLINAAALLTQAAHYIRVLQVQVEALHSLNAGLSRGVDHLCLPVNHPGC